MSGRRIKTGASRPSPRFGLMGLSLQESSNTLCKNLSREGGAKQWCCVTELKLPSSGTSSNFDGTGTELVGVDFYNKTPKNMELFPIWVERN